MIHGLFFTAVVVAMYFYGSYDLAGFKKPTKMWTPILIT
jgi:hypothetical protein